ncbi:MAG: family 78 glycoside hydrolase catalytic domain [Clostridia bacterium]|nr:family 78 glycoside hydrolase catalytic domain [Clostridia bacterium]
MLKNAKFIKNTHIVVEDRDSWRNMGYNDKSKILPDKGGIVLFKKKFTSKKPISKAYVTATALGIFELYINDERVGEKTQHGTVYDELKPGWTDYSHRVFAFRYDIAHLLTHGENDITAEVSCGWYSCRISFGIYGFRVPAFCAEIRVEYDDGTCEVIATDDTWQTALAGPVRTADIWDGEYYDARINRSDGNWENATLEEYDGIIEERAMPRILMRHDLERTAQTATVYEHIKDNGTEFGEICVEEKREGACCEKGVLRHGKKLILDFGQNSVGRPRLTLQAERGAKITVYFAEFLNDTGSAAYGNDGAKGSTYVKNYRSALSRFVYVASGNGVETYAPLHTFFGYRYLEIEASADVKIESVRGEVISSVPRETAKFECSNDEVNRLWSNIVWGMRGNYLSIPTDCPQRDERLGWTGDTQIFCGAGSYIGDIYDFMRKWLQDMRDSQSEDGSYCDVIPKVFKKERFFGNTAWADAGIIVPYEMYKKYGRTEILSEHYDSMEKYMRYLSKFGTDGANTAYGDWLSYEETDKRYIAVCYYAYVAKLMENISDILGKTARAKHYSDLFNTVRQDFISRYIHEDELVEKTQTGYLLALKFDLIPANMREKCMNELRRKIEDNGCTLSTGFVGTGVLMMTLAELGMHDLCYSLLLQTKNPSWLYSVQQGATTVWERWNSYTRESGFGKVEMNSFNHYAYGAVGEWQMAYMAGIRAGSPGFEHIYIAPVPDERETLPEGQKRIEYVNAEYESVKGRICSSWKRQGDNYMYRVKVPCDATLIFVQHNGKNLRIMENENILPVISDGKVRFEVKAGTYTLCE